MKRSKAEQLTAFWFECKEDGPNGAPYRIVTEKVLFKTVEKKKKMNNDIEKRRVFDWLYDVCTAESIYGVSVDLPEHFADINYGQLILNGNDLYSAGQNEVPNCYKEMRSNWLNVGFEAGTGYDPKINFIAKYHNEIDRFDNSQRICSLIISDERMSEDFVKLIYEKEENIMPMMRSERLYKLSDNEIAGLLMQAAYSESKWSNEELERYLDDPRVLNIRP